MKGKFILRGDIWLVNMGKVVGSEQGGTRYCLVIQNDIGNQYAPTVTVVPITSQTKNFNKTHVEIMLKEKSYILCEQIRTVDKSRMIRRVCRVDDDIMKKVCSKIRLHFRMN